jgi:UDP-N-acetyl-D-galactosamine dehydrogenase
VLGLTFKENVPDTRNAKVHDLIRKLQADGMTLEGCDPWLSDEQIQKLDLFPGNLEKGSYDVILLAVTHREFANLKADVFKKALKKGGIFYDLRSVFRADDFEGYRYLSL